MLERETYPPQEPQIQYTRPTSFDLLGIVDERKKSPTVITSDIICVKVSNLQDESVAYLAFHNYGYYRDELAQVVNSIAPVQVRFEPRAGMLGDFRMPIRVESGSARTEERDLHHDHMEDPVIKEPYGDFIRNHNARWVKALETYDPLENLINTIQFVDSEHLASQTFQELLMEMDIIARYPHSRIYTGTLAQYGRALLYEQGNNRRNFSQFLATHIRPDDTPLLEDSRISVYFYLSPEQKLALVREYLDQVGEEDQEEFAMNYLVNDEHILVDPAKSKVWITHDAHAYFDNTEIAVDDESTVVIRDVVDGREEQAVLKLETSEGKNGQKRWRITEVDNSFDRNDIFGVLAWKKTKEGNRRFLTQEEVTTLLPEDFPLLDRSDVFLGRVLIAYLSPNITAAWPKTMFLTHRKNPQRMMSAQVAVWTSIDEHARQLLSDQNRAITTLENYIDEEAA